MHLWCWLTRVQFQYVHMPMVFPKILVVSLLYSIVRVPYNELPCLCTWLSFSPDSVSNSSINVLEENPFSITILPMAFFHIYASGPSRGGRLDLTLGLAISLDLRSIFLFFATWWWCSDSMDTSSFRESMAGMFFLPFFFFAAAKGGGRCPSRGGIGCC